jgi:GT2 family glycosyltransferase
MNPDPRAIEAVVCIPTFRRPEGLTRTLASLAAQRTARRFAVVIAENDAAGRAGEGAATAFLAEASFPGLVTVEPAQGNCSAINAAFSLALEAYPAARHLLMVDDDEVASPDWLERMVAAAEAAGADIVGGPVFPQLPAGIRPGLARHPAFAPAFVKSGPVPLIYGSGNCLIAREAFARMGAPYFDVRYNFLGGGDTDFFVRARRAGLAFHWVAEAVVTEDVPSARTRPSWLAARGLRVGAVNHRIELRHARGMAGRTKLALKSLGILALSLPRALRLLIQTREPLVALHPVLVGLGRALAALGIETQQYRAKAGATS